MPLFENDRLHINALCKEQRFAEARDYLLARQGRYLRQGRFIRSSYHENLGKIYTSLCEFEKADEEFNFAIGATHLNFSPRLSYIESMIKRGRLCEADKLLTEIVEREDSISPAVHIRNVRLQLLMGKFFKLLGNYAEAMDCYEQCLPYLDKQSSARRDYQFLLDIRNNQRTDRLTGLINHINFLRDSRYSGDTTLRNRQAREFLANRVAEEKSSPWACATLHSLMARCWLDMDDKEQALEHANAAIALNSGNSYAHITRILAYLSQNDVASAVAAFDAVSGLIIDSPNHAAILARAFRAAGEYPLQAAISNPDTSPDTRRAAHIILGSAALTPREHP